MTARYDIAAIPNIIIIDTRSNPALYQSVLRKISLRVQRYYRYCRDYTAIGALMLGCGSYHVSVKSSYVKSNRFFIAGLSVIVGRSFASLLSCSLT
jgi:hypothetical protein